MMPTRAAEAALSLARVLYWRGRYGDADSTLQQVIDPQPRPIQVQHSLLVARVATGQRDYTRAMAATSAAQQAAADAGDPALVAAAAYTAAFVHMAVADWPAVEQTSRRRLSPRAAHPIRCVPFGRACSVPKPSAGGAGVPAARVDLEHLRRIVATLPPILRVRWQAATAIAATPADAEAIVARMSPHRCSARCRCMSAAVPRRGGRAAPSHSSTS